MKKLKSTKRLLSLMAIVFVVTLGFNVLEINSAHAFKIWIPALSPPVHEEITIFALDASRLSNAINSETSNWAFTSLAKYQITVAAKQTDIFTIAGTLDGTDVWHFDNGKLIQGAELIRGVRLEILRLIFEADTSFRYGDINAAQKKSQEARILLGNILHTIQDFYSHSNWVENKRLGNSSGENSSGIADLDWYESKKANLRKKKTNPFLGKPTGSCLCGSPIDIYLTSAFYFGKYLGFLETPFWDDAAAVEAMIQGKCVHSETDDDERKANWCGIGGNHPIDNMLYPVLPGMDKDKEGRPWPRRSNETKSLHLQAKEMAIDASAAFTQGVLLEAKDANLSLGLCGFLGYDTTSACSFLEGPFEYEQVLPFYRVGDTYFTAEAFTFDIDLFDSSLGTLNAVRSEWSAEFSGTGTCPADPSQIEFRANECQFLRAIRNFYITSPNPNVTFQMLYCNTVFGDPSFGNSLGRIDICGINSLFYGDIRAVFDFQMRWPGGTQTFQEIGTRKSRYVVAGPGRTCGLCTDVVGASTAQIDGTFVSRLTGYLGIDNAQGTFFPSTSPYVSFEGNMKIKLRLTYEYSSVPGSESPALANLGGNID